MIRDTDKKGSPTPKRKEKQASIQTTTDLYSDLQNIISNKDKIFESN